MSKISIYIASVLCGLFLIMGCSNKPKNSTVSTAVESKEIVWVSFAEAIEQSKKVPKPIFIDVYTDWCGWCKRMDVTTFKDQSVVDYMNKNYYCIKFDAEGGESITFPNEKTYTKSGRSHELAVELLDGRMSYPSVVYLDKAFTKIQAVPGYREADELIMISKYFGEDHYKTTDWEKFKEQYVSNGY